MVQIEFIEELYILSELYKTCVNSIFAKLFTSNDSLYNCFEYPRKSDHTNMFINCYYNTNVAQVQLLSPIYFHLIIFANIEFFEKLYILS